MQQLSQVKQSEDSLKQSVSELSKLNQMRKQLSEEQKMYTQDAQTAIAC